MIRPYTSLVATFAATVVCFASDHSPEVNPAANEIIPPTQGVTPANFRRIRHGMSLKAVDNIMGQPGKYYLGWTGVRWYSYEANGYFVRMAMDGLGVEEACCDSRDGRRWSLLSRRIDQIFGPHP